MPPKLAPQEKIDYQEAQESEFSYQTEEPVTSGESVKVALRLRPLNSMELSRGDTSVVKAADKITCQLLQK